MDPAAEGQGYQAHRYRGPRPAHAEGAEVSAQEIEDLYIRDPWYFTEKREKEEKNNLLTDLLTNLLTHLRTNLLTNLLTNLRFNFDFLWAEYIFGSGRLWGKSNLPSNRRKNEKMRFLHKISL